MKTIITPIILIASCLLLLSGCGSNDTEVSENIGMLCLKSPTQSEPTLPADQPLELVVTASFGSNFEPTSASCSVDVSGNQLNVTSEFVFDRLSHDEEPDISIFSTVRCSVDALPPGEYQIVHGHRNGVVVVPSDEDVLECATLVDDEAQIPAAWRF